jgi:hypothetical protein
MSRWAVRVRSSALFFACKSRINEKPSLFAWGALSAVDSIPRPRPYVRRRAFLCWVSGASSGQESWLCWRALGGAGPFDHTLQETSETGLARHWSLSCYALAYIRPDDSPMGRASEMTPPR